MYRLLLIFLLIGNICQAQIQFWTRDEIIEKQFQQERKEMGIKAAYNFVTSENWLVKDSSDYNEIFEYDREGRKTVYKIYKTDWVKKQKYFQMIDSFFYNDKGVFMGMKRYSPGAGGGYFTIEYAAKTILDAKGRIARINYYGGYGASELNDYHVYTYDAKNKVSLVTAFDAMKKKTADWKITYDANGRVSKVKFTTYYGGSSDFTDYLVKYNSKGLLDSYAEMYKGKERSNSSGFLYDENNRTIRRDYMTNHNYADTIGYWYNGNDRIYDHTYLKYPRPAGHETDFAHEFRAYRFEYY